jgi:hypothetical protein
VVRHIFQTMDILPTPVLNSKMLFICHNVTHAYIPYNSHFQRFFVPFR